MELTPSGRVTRVGNELVEIDFADLEPGRVALELALLKEELSDSLLVRPLTNAVSVEIERAPSSNAQRATAIWEKNRLRLYLSQRELGYWLAFFLRYFRDRRADVDHIDLEAKSAKSGGGQIDVVLKVASAAPPVDAQEARRRLNL